MAGNVRDYELLLKVRADLQQAVGGLGQLSKSLRDLDKTGAAGFKNIEASLGRIGNLANSLKGALAAVGVGFGVKEVLDNVIEAETQARQLEQRLKSTGGAAGLTKEQLLGLADSLQGLTAFEDDAIVGAENLLLTFKNIKGPVFQQATEAVLDMSTALGQDLKSSAVQLGKALNDPVQGISALSRVGITFTADQQKVIKALVETGHTADAQRLILRELSSEMGGSARAAADTFGGSLAQVKNAFGNLLEGDGRGLNDAKVSLQQFRDILNSPEVKAGFATLVSGLVNLVGYVAQATAAFVGLGQAIADSFRSDENKTYEGLLSKRAELVKQLDYINKFGGGKTGSFLGIKGITVDDLKAQIKALDDLLAARRKVELQAPKIEIPAVSTQPVVLPTSRAEDPEAAAKRASAQAEAFKRLQDVISGLRGDVGGPAEKAWQDYAAAVQKAAEAGGDAIRNGANVADVQKQVAEAVTLAAQKREQSLNALSDQARQAYEQLRQELRTPAEAATETAQARIKVLDDALRQGIIDAKAYQQELGRVVTAGFDKAPQYQGLAPEVGGASGEIGKTFDAQKELQVWYARQLELLNQFRAQKLGTEAQWDAQEQALRQQHAQALQAIEQARHIAELAAAGDAFGQLADIAKAGLGEQSRAYKALFAISKAFAVAQAATSLAINVSKASEVGFPYNLAFIAGALAQGAQIASIIGGASFNGAGGYAEGGLIRGTGTGTSDSVPIWSSNGEFVQRTAAVRYYGVDFMDAVNNLQFPRYADGGLVGNLDGATSARPPSLAPAQGAAATPQINQRIVVGFDGAALDDWATGSSFERAVKVVIGRNPSFIRQAVR